MTQTRFSTTQYTPTLQKIIEECVQTDGIDASAMIMKTVFESLLEAERTIFFEQKNIQDQIGDIDDTVHNKRNGYYSRLVKSLSGRFTLRVPRDRRNMFEPLCLEVIANEQKDLSEAAYLLYTKGMSTRDVADVMKQLYGSQVSPGYVSTVTKRFEPLRKQWEMRQLQSQYYAIYIDAIHVNIRRTDVANEAIYVAIGIGKDCKREILGLYSIPQESASGWGTIFADLRERGVQETLLVVADGLTGLENQVHTHFPRAYFQKCIVHLKRNILTGLRSKDKREMADDLLILFDMNDTIDTLKHANERIDTFLDKWNDRYPKIQSHFPESIRNYFFTYLHFPHTIRRLIYTTNWIERLNKEIRKVLKNKNSLPNEAAALNLIWSTVMQFEERVYKYPVNNFSPAITELNSMFIHNSQTQLS